VFNDIGRSDRQPQPNTIEISTVYAMFSPKQDVWGVRSLNGDFQGMIRGMIPGFPETADAVVTRIDASNLEFAPYGMIMAKPGVSRLWGAITD